MKKEDKGGWKVEKFKKEWRERGQDTCHKRKREELESFSKTISIFSGFVGRLSSWDWPRSSHSS